MRADAISNFRFILFEYPSMDRPARFSSPIITNVTNYTKVKNLGQKTSIMFRVLMCSNSRSSVNHFETCSCSLDSGIPLNRPNKLRNCVPV